MGIASPRVALLSNGEEPGKGTPELVAVHERLAGEAGTGLNFIGNVEGTQVTDGVADVVVMDGFTGNITLKLIEGVSGRTLRAIRDAAMSSTRGQARWLAAGAGGRALARGDRSRDDRRRVHARAATARASSRTAASPGAASQRAIEVAARGVEEDVIGATREAARSGRGAACAAARRRAERR